MTEHTKGKLRVSKNYRRQKVLIRTIDDAVAVAAITDEIHGSLETREARAAEFVRRWNAFEDDGCVEDLVEACKRIKRRLDDGGIIEKDTHGLYNCLKNALVKAEEQKNG